MPTDYLEAEKLLPDFKLDINDKIAFTKVLFGGSQVELNEVVAKLNSFKIRSSQRLSERCLLRKKLAKSR
jgi:hypothetical protein